MFAYCNNSPILLADAAGTVSKVCITADGAIDDTPGYDLSPGGGGYVRAYAYRGTYSKISGLINGQMIFEHKNARCGIGNYANNGCAIIAIYNAMQLMNKAQSLGAIEHEFLTQHGMILWGAFGAGPWSYDNYFDAHGISNTGYRDYSSFLQDVSEGDVVVFTVVNNVWNPFEAFHSMAAQYVGGQFIVYNAYGTYASPWYTDSLHSIYESSGWIYGYIIGG